MYSQTSCDDYHLNLMRTRLSPCITLAKRVHYIAKEKRLRQHFMSGGICRRSATLREH
jgi:hypothetical protein